MDQIAKINRHLWDVRSKSRSATNFESERLKNSRRYGTIKKIPEVAKFYRGFTGCGQVCAPRDTRFRDFAELHLPSFQTNHVCLFDLCQKFLKFCRKVYIRACLYIV